MNAPELDPLEWMEARQLLQSGLDEDGARRDVTSKLAVPEGVEARAVIRSRESGVLAGAACIPMSFEALGESVDISMGATDGDRLRPGQSIARIDAPLRSMLAVERTLLNLVGQLSGIASLTARYVDAVGPICTVLDTRKTWPGSRRLQKYAVRCGGGTNHRMGLSDAILFKDNHRWGGTSLVDLVSRARKEQPRMLLIVEVDDLIQLETALELPVDRILLDNFTTQGLRDALDLRSRMRRDTPFELSGGITLERARDLAAAGAEFISVGALTHSAPCLDIGLDVEDRALGHA